MNSAGAARTRGRLLACVAPQSSAVEQAGLSLCARTEKDVPAFPIFVQMNKIFDKASSNVQSCVCKQTRAGEKNDGRLQF